MPVKDHPSFDTSLKANDKLWRYTDILKLLHLLNNGALFFTSQARLTSLDPFEGMLPDANYMHRNWRNSKDIPESHLQAVSDVTYEKVSIDEKLTQYKDIMEHFVRVFQIMRTRHCVSCWHLNDTESAAMWQLYSQRGFGVAIVSDVERLRKAFSDAHEDLYFGKVQYKDYGSFAIDIGNTFNALQFKRKSFEHENEVRIVHSVPAQSAPLTALDIPGVSIQCDLNKLIQEIIVSPHEAPWQFMEIQKLINTYMPDVRVSHSQLITPPSN